jgi:hypothetical protein
MSTPAENVTEIVQRERGVRPATAAIALLFGGIATAVGAYGMASGQGPRATFVTVSGGALLALGTYYLIPGPGHVIYPTNEVN